MFLRYCYFFNTPKQQRAKPKQYIQYNAKKLLQIATNNRQTTFQNTATLYLLLLSGKLPSDHSQYSTCMPAHTCYPYVWLQANAQSSCPTPKCTDWNALFCLSNDLLMKKVFALIHLSNLIILHINSRIRSSSTLTTGQFSVHHIAQYMSCRYIASFCWVQ